MSTTRAYLDTCIVSGLAKGDLGSETQAALLRILEARKVGRVELVTSEVTRSELAAIPEVHRGSHSAIYYLLADVPLAPAEYRIPPFKPAPMFRRRDKLLLALEALLPDAADASHAFQAARSMASYLITTDRRTMLKHADAVEALCNLKLVNPSQFENSVLRGASG